MAITSFGQGISKITGLQYGSDASAVYYYYGMGLKAVDIFFGIVGIGLAVFAIITRQKRAHYKTNAPKMLLIAYESR